MKFVDDEINNYIDFENKQLIIRIHKNNNKGKGTRILKLIDDEIDVLKNHKEITKLDLYLLVNFLIHH